MDAYKEQLDRIEKMLQNQGIQLKELLTVEEVALYTGYKKSHLYKLTSAGKIPHYKPGGKVIYFRKNELDEWLMRNKVYSEEEIQEAAQNFVLRSGNKTL